jgi:hypothetical protein
MRRYTAAFVSLALIGLMGLPAAGQDVTDEGRPLITAVRTGLAPSIDGQVTPQEWKNSAPVHVEASDPTQQPGVVPLRGDGTFNPRVFPPPEDEQDLSFDIRAMYDDQFLYVAVVVTDDAIFHDSPGAWEDDDVELLIDGDRAIESEAGLELSQLLCDAGGELQENSLSSDDSEWWTAAAELTDTGYAVEFRISLSSIDVVDGDAAAPPQPGDIIGFNVAVADDDNGGKAYNGFGQDDPAVDGMVMWTGAGSVGNEAEYGRLYFDPSPAVTAVTATSWGTLKKTRTEPTR